MNGIESAREEERGRRTAQINLPLDFNNRIEPADTEIGKCACVCCCFILFLERGREQEELREEEEKEPHRGDR